MLGYEDQISFRRLINVLNDSKVIRKVRINILRTILKSELGHNDNPQFLIDRIKELKEKGRQNKRVKAIMQDD